jgi:NTE family protein
MAKIGVAFSGGGSRCIAQLGVLQYLKECDVEISAVSGSSGGAIIAGLYAKGLEPKAILSVLDEIDYKSHLKYNFTNGTLYHLNKAIKDFQVIFGKLNMEDLNIPFFCTVTDYESGEEEYRTSGDLVTLMLASSALTPIFAPVKYDNKTYIDGGFCDNLPSHPLRDICDKVIGINVNPVGKYIKDSFKAHYSRALLIMLHSNVRAGIKECDLLIEVREMGRYSIFDLKDFEHFFELGYNEAKKHKIDIERLLVDL